MLHFACAFAGGRAQLRSANPRRSFMVWPPLRSGDESGIVFNEAPLRSTHTIASPPRRTGLLFAPFSPLAHYQAPLALCFQRRICSSIKLRNMTFSGIRGLICFGI
ncbi:MAG: hypothetical protein IPM82_14150 [Saprospiraceae bacterium]|nr:hypothetical protein [Saprospiraceae bacterium]